MGLLDFLFKRRKPNYQPVPDTGWPKTKIEYRTTYQYGNFATRDLRPVRVSYDKPQAKSNRLTTDSTTHNDWISNPIHPLNPITDPFNVYGSRESFGNNNNNNESNLSAYTSTNNDYSSGSDHSSSSSSDSSSDGGGGGGGSFD